MQNAVLENGIEAKLSRGQATLAKGLEILCLFSEQRPTISVHDVISHLKVPRSTAYRYLRTLRQYGFIEEDSQSSRFRLGMKMLELSRLAGRRHTLVEVALPVMKRLCDETGESVFLSVANGTNAVCLERVESQNPVRFSYERGKSSPLHGGASAKVLLAFLDKDTQSQVINPEKLPKLGPNTITDPKELKDELSRIRQRGYAFSQEEVDPGAWAIAVPILARNGRLLASLTVGGPIHRLPPERDELAKRLKEAAAEIAAGVEDYA